jgi:hypothetical protein
MPAGKGCFIRVCAYGEGANSDRLTGSPGIAWIGLKWCGRCCVKSFSRRGIRRGSAGVIGIEDLKH